MRPPLLPLGLFVLLGGCAAPRPAWSDVGAAIAAHPGRDVGVAYLDLGGGEPRTWNADEVFHAASTMKIAVLLALYRRAHLGQLDLDAPVAVENRFASIVDGSPYALDPAEDADPELYDHVGGALSSRELARRMIARSSNLATNLLVDVVGARAAQRTIEDLGTTRMQVLRGVEDTKAYRAGRSNTATARDLMVLLEAIASGRAVSAEASEEMLAILEAQEFNDLIPAALPAGTRVAHKTGWITAIRHDAAVVFPAGASPYVLVVLTRGFEDPEEAAAAIRAVAERVHAHHLAGD